MMVAMNHGIAGLESQPNRFLDFVASLGERVEEERMDTVDTSVMASEDTDEPVDGTSTRNCWLEALMGSTNRTWSHCVNNFEDKCWRVACGPFSSRYRM